MTPLDSKLGNPQSKYFLFLVEMIFNYAFGKNATITSHLLNDEVYIVHSVHFHWGESDE